MYRKTIYLILTGTLILAACASPAPAPTAIAAADAATAAPAAAPEATVAPTAVPVEPTAAPNVNSIGKLLPDDAAPSEQQVLVITSDTQAASEGALFMDLTASVYNRSLGDSLFSFSLVRVDKDYNVIPGLAETFTPNATNTEWIFKLRDDVNWSDGTQLTAADVIASFQHMADPATAYDFSWYIEEMKIKGYSEALKGEVKPTEIGVRQGATPKEVVFELSTAIPFLPMLMLYSAPMQKTALDKYGPTYGHDLKTTVSAGPYMLEEWSPTRVVLKANPDMPDDLKPYLNKVIFIKPKSELQAFQAGEVERARVGSGADVQTIAADPELAKLAAQDPGDMRVHYFFFDDSKPPFNNLKVRQAFAHLFDREAIMQTILPAPAANPAYSMLSPGFPGSNEEALKSYQMYDPELAKKLFAESGVKITSKLTLLVRGGSPIEEPLVAMAGVYAEAIKANLGVDVEVQRQESKVFMDALNAEPTKIQFGMVSYGLDFMDQSNMLSVFRNDGRHNWNNDVYNDLINNALAEPDKAKRDQMYLDAEKLLVEEVGAVFALQQFDVWVWKPYISGVTFQPGKVNTARGIGWPGFSSLDPGCIDTYITKNVADFRPEPPQ